MFLDGAGADGTNQLQVGKKVKASFLNGKLHKSINDNQLFSLLFFHAHIPSDKKQLKDFQICFPLIMGKYSG